MKKYISLFALPVFLIGVSFALNTKTQHAQADVPVAPASCPTGTMTLRYADGSVADAYVGQPAAINPNDPIPAGVDPDVLVGVDKWERRNGYRKASGNPIPFNLTTKAYANGDIYTAAGLTEVVKLEGGGGPYCYNAVNGGIYEALSNQNCNATHPGTQFAGFKVEVVYRDYMCGTPSPWTDG